MKKTIFWLVLAVICASSASALAQEELFSLGDVAVIKIGEKISSTTVTPLFAIRVGDTSVAEMEIVLWQKIFGLYARNAIFYTRDSNGNWKATGYRRPMTDEEAEKFTENPLYFYAEKVINFSELPASLGNLNLSELAQVSWVMEYLRGGIQIYPRDGNRLEEVISLAKKIFFFTRPKADV